MSQIISLNTDFTKNRIDCQFPQRCCCPNGEHIEIGLSEEILPLSFVSSKYLGSDYEYSLTGEAKTVTTNTLVRTIPLSLGVPYCPNHLGVNKKFSQYSQVLLAIINGFGIVVFATLFFFKFAPESFFLAFSSFETFFYSDIIGILILPLIPAALLALLIWAIVSSLASFMIDEYFTRLISEKMRIDLKALVGFVSLNDYKLGTNAIVFRESNNNLVEILLVFMDDNYANEFLSLNPNAEIVLDSAGKIHQQAAYDYANQMGLRLGWKLNN